MKSESCSVVSNSTTPWTTQSVEYSRPEYKNTRVGSYSLLQGIVPTQGLNPGLPHCRQILYQLSHQGSIYTYTHTHTHTYIYIYTHTYICIFFIFFHFDLSQDVEYSSLCFQSRTLLLICSIYTSLHLPIPNIQYFPLPAPLLLCNHKYILCL